MSQFGIVISEADPAPIYLQIVNHFRVAILSGRLQPEEEIPSIRSLAEQLVVNPNTVARAYRELEQLGLITTKRTSGSIVSPNITSLAKEELLCLLDPHVDTLFSASDQLRLSTEEVTDYVAKKGKARNHEVSN
ncbi:MAG: GntR family transcriptional regulator [Armatimonadetes bacterium]|nr:GntR family transcriptional regulator [Armatimonadota bacterium]